MEYSKQVIIVAGGSGTRMKSIVPKQFLTLGSQTILEHTINRFLGFDSEIQVVVVIPKEHDQYWDELSVEITQNKRVKKTYGGTTRYHSVKNGLSMIDKNFNGVVGIHDGVRPIISNEFLSRCYDKAFEYGNAIPGVPIVETLRKYDGTDTHWVDRNLFRAIQTPQCFDYRIVADAYDQPYSSMFTDDASVVESKGISIQMVEGERNNIKITTPEDLELAQKMFL